MPFSRLNFSRITTALLWLGLSSLAHSTDLLQAWQAALQRDPEFAAAKSLADQGPLRQQQALSLWRPLWHAGALLGVGGQDMRTTGAQSNGVSGIRFNTAVGAGAVGGVQVMAQQALINPELQAQTQQLQLSAQMMQVQWQQAQQDLIWRTAQKYFALLSAEFTLGVLQGQQQALQKASAEIAKRQRVGDATVMDTQEAELRLAEIRVQVFNAQNDLDLKRLAYRQITGQSPQKLAALQGSSALALTAVADVSAWLNRARQQAPPLQVLSLQQSLQQQELEKIKGTQALRVDAVAQAQMDRLVGQGLYGSSSNQMSQYRVGVQFNMPLSSGGYAESRELEALKQLEKIGYEQDLAQLQLEAQVREAWLNLSTAPARLRALEQADKASKRRVAATRQAHRTGARTTMELLSAEHDAAQAELVWMQLSIQTVLDRLRLQASTGELGEAQLREVNALLR